LRRREEQNKGQIESGRKGDNEETERKEAWE
jgi:hypothetical protein